MSLFKKLFILVVFLLGIVFYFLFVGSPDPKEDVVWGVNFSSKHTANLGLDPRQTFIDLADDLGVRRFKIAAHWDYLNPERLSFNFKETDWQFEHAAKVGAKIVLAIGMKTPRWPECHIPEWAKPLNKAEQQEAIRAYLTEVVNRYKDHPALHEWQVENEPFFQFGDCPWYDLEFVKEEVALVKKLDPNHKIMITDSGEFSFWWKPALIGDKVGTTLYRKVWFKQFSRYMSYPFAPAFYTRRAWLIETFLGKPVIDAELQAEPWGPVLYYDLDLEEQMKTMPIEQFRANIDFAKRTHLSEAYFWGAEWWDWMRLKKNDPSYWEEAKKLFTVAN